MKMSNYFMPTLKEDPVDAEVMSHKLMVRAGMIRKSASGVYSYLPLGFRVIKKIERIVREEMDRFGAQEILMSAIQPKEIWEDSGRWDVYGPEMFKLEDRNGRGFCLGPTAEEYFTTLIKGELKSYKQLPLNLYQIQTKYRDEKRPRFGINRAREFSMKDAYTFDSDKESMKEAYMNMWKAYVAVFDRLGLEYIIVEGDVGAMGGLASHEFIALSDVGEGVVCYCDQCDYAATDEKARVVYQVNETDEPLALEEVSTPGARTIEQVATYLGTDPSRCAKAIDLVVKDEPVVVLIPGDRELNLFKLLSYLGAADHEVEMANETVVRSIGSAPGFTGPVGLSARVIADERITRMKNMVVGANRSDAHLIHVNYGRDFTAEVVEDLLMAEEKDPCPECEGTLHLRRGIEIGNIFQLGTKYSEALHATFLDTNGKEQFFWMGSYGIGITRSVVAVIEQNFDEKGIVWPLGIAPYHCIITVVNTKDHEQMELGEQIYEELQQKGVEVLLDDRKERAGVKFADRELVGIPLQITVGKKAPENIVEFAYRSGTEKEELPADQTIEKVVSAVRDSHCTRI